ncbi:unnamed protein product [Nippostrongylus brasiliensis]|uniref:NOB1_Zn_bind domain-containing protein n=1 Tax=Nippostrongylus brasiliensis TaxID=27835 RepID=A0A0N4YAS0_NIPBR|nr:unnamed protein product [Nippostrongylus brasiliensis]
MSSMGFQCLRAKCFAFVAAWIIASQMLVRDTFQLLHFLNTSLLTTLHTLGLGETIHYRSVHYRCTTCRMQFVFLGMTDMCPCQVKKVSRTLEVIGGDTSRAAIQKDLAFISYVKHFAIPVLVNNPVKTTGSQENKNATKRKIVDDSTSIADSTTPKTPRRDSMQGVRTPAYYEDGTIRTPRGYDDDEEEIE